MYATSTSTAQQLAADRHASFEGVAARRRLRKLARRTRHDAANEAVLAPRPTARFVAPRIAPSPTAAAHMPVSRKVA